MFMFGIHDVKEYYSSLRYADLLKMSGTDNCLSFDQGNFDMQHRIFGTEKLFFIARNCLI